MLKFRWLCACRWHKRFMWIPWVWVFSYTLSRISMLSVQSARDIVLPILSICPSVTLRYCLYKIPRKPHSMSVRYTGWVIICDFRPKLPFISVTMDQPIDPSRFQWPWVTLKSGNARDPLFSGGSPYIRLYGIGLERPNLMTIMTMTNGWGLQQRPTSQITKNTIHQK